MFVALLALVVGAVVLTPTTGAAAELPNRAPGLSVPIAARVLVGDELVVTVRAIDLDFDRVRLWAPALPDGVRRGATTSTTASFTVSGVAPGRVEFVVAAADEHGAMTSRVVAVDVRHPHRPDALLGLGDSVASGFGLDRSDFLNRDQCWRDEGEAYPRQVFDGLRETGALGADAEFWLLACQGARASDLATVAVGGGPADLATAEVRERTQLDWAARTNAGVVTLTVGANDLRFSTPTAFVRDGMLDETALAATLADYERHLADVLRTLVRGTDSTVYLATYYDPSASNPEGVDGCRGACFSNVVDTAVDRLNQAVAAVAERYPGDRVVVVDLEPVFAGHGAPNGIGPDAIRAGGWGVLGRVLGRFTSGVQAFCSSSYTSHDTFVSAIDCVHPDADGATAIADAVLEVAAAEHPRNSAISNGR